MLSKRLSLPLLASSSLRKSTCTDHYLLTKPTRYSAPPRRVSVANNRRASVLHTRRDSVLKAAPTETLFLYGDTNQKDKELGDYLFYSDPNSEAEDDDDNGYALVMGNMNPKTMASNVLDDDEYDVNEAMGTPSKSTPLSIPASPAKGPSSAMASSLKSPLDQSLADAEKGDPDDQKRKARAAAQKKIRRPWFLIAMTVLQLLGMGLEFFFSWYWQDGPSGGPDGTGVNPLQTDPFNYLIGPPVGTLIHMGGVYSSCMRTEEISPGVPLNSSVLLICNLGMKFPDSPRNDSVGNPICSLQEVCGLHNFGDSPNQVYRFATAMFLHGGVVHLLANLFLQYRLGFELEKSVGAWRIGIIYFIAGIGGFVFSACFSVGSVSVGSSGALYGIILPSLVYI